MQLLITTAVRTLNPTDAVIVSWGYRKKKLTVAQMHGYKYLWLRRPEAEVTGANLRHGSVTAIWTLQ
jgi:hypothetical protein